MYWFENSDLTQPGNYLKGEQVTGLCQDHEGGMWLSTLENGVYFCNSSSILNFGPSSGLRDAEVRSLGLQDDSIVWAGLKDGSVARIRDDRVEDPGLGSLGGARYVTRFYEDEHKRLQIPWSLGRR